MKKKRARLVGLGLVAGVLMLGIQSRAAVLAYDGFTSSASGDVANGIYKTGLSFTNSANSTVAGGDMVGVRASDAWAAHSEYHIIGGKGALSVSWTASRNASRPIAVNMAGKTVAWASAKVSAYLPDYSTGSYVPLAMVGFSDTSFGSTAGAGLGFRWNRTTDQWDISTRHLDGGWVYGTVQAGVGTDTGEFFLVWKMDDASDKLSVWVNPSGTNDAPTAEFDYDGHVYNIDHMNVLTYRVNDTLPAGTDVFTFSDLKLGDTMQDVVPLPTTLKIFSLGNQN